MAAGKDGDLTPVGRKRRSWKWDEKRQIVEESLQDGASIAEVARRHDLNANLLFTWRRQLGLESIETNDLTRILPVTITAEAMEERGLESSGQMEIILSGGERILVWTDVETAALSRVLKALGRR
jgi:transposase